MAKPVLLLLPGTLCDSALWAYQTESLSHRVTCVHGDVSRFDNLPDLAAELLRQLPSRFAVAGLSYGGIVAFELLRQARDRITGLALLNTTARLPAPETREKQLRFLQMADRGQFREITTDHLKDAMLHPRSRQDQRLREEILAMAERIGVAGFINQTRAQLQRPDSRPDLPSVRCPVLIMTGREDRVCNVALHEEMAALIPGSTLEIIPECGHLSTMEQSETVTQAMLRWLDTIYPE